MTKREAAAEADQIRPVQNTVAAAPALRRSSIFIVPTGSAGYGRIMTTANPRFLFCHENCP